MRKPPDFFLAALALLIGAFCIACENATPQYRDGPASAQPSVTSTLPATTGTPGTDRMRNRKRANKGITGVYVDGELRAVLRYGELPPTFEPTIVDRRGDSTINNMVGYLTALGVDVSKVTGLHMEGSGRTAAITGDELRRHTDTLHFAFSKLQGTYGKARIDWPATKNIKTTTRIDKVAALHVFENKPAPIWDRAGRTFRWADGSKVDGTAYIGRREKIKSARLYVDGRLLGLIDDIDGLPAEVMHTGDGKGTGKATQNMASDEEEEDEEDAPKPGDKGGGGGGKKVLLAKYLAHRGVDLSAVKTVEIIGEDRVLGRFSGALWAEYVPKLTFGTPKRKKRKLRLELEEPATPYPGPVLAQAIAVYTTVKPRDRKIALPRWRPRRK